MARKEGDGQSEGANHSRVLATTRGLATKITPLLPFNSNSYKLLRFVLIIVPKYLGILDTPPEALCAMRVGSCTILTAIKDFYCVW